jgi:Tat protein translocase TatB subunit
MGNLGFWEIFGLGLLALVIFGPDRLPEVARNLGRTIAAFRREANSTLAELRRSADLDDLRDLREEWRATTSDLKPRSILGGPMATASNPSAPARTDAPPPYDRDAT